MKVPFLIILVIPQGIEQCKLGISRSETSKVKPSSHGSFAMATISGNSSNNTLVGTDQDDVINGLAGNDLIQGLQGNDIIDGGTGIDTADYREKTLGITVTLSGSIDSVVTVGGTAEDTLRRVENIFGGSGDDFITGDVLANTFRGGLGADILDGGAGIDTADYSDKSQSVVVTLNGSSDSTVTVGGTAEDTLRNIENVIGGSAGDILTGDSLNNSFQGGGGADVVDGGDGADTADFREKTASVVVSLNGAADATVFVGGIAEDTLRNVENLIGGSAGDTFIGDTLANKLSGAEGNDWLCGGLGADILDGGEDIDTADYSDKNASVSVTLNGSSLATVTIGGVAEDSILKIENIVGGSGDDFITGDVQANTFRGGLGADTLDGGAGVDTADYGDKTQAVVLTLSGASNALVTVNGSAEDTLRNIENVIGGSADDTLTGDSLNNSFQGEAGADIIDGGSGSDTADYRDKSGPMTVVLNGANASTVFVGGVAEDSIRNIESILAGSGDDSLTGDALANTLDGGAGNDTVDYSGRTGSVLVTLNGGTDAKVTIGGRLDDTLRNVENIIGGSGSDTIIGDAHVNVLTGGGGGDILKGGLGSDILDGGIGSDTADFSDKTASVVVTLNGSNNAVATVGGVAEDTLRNIENIFGGAGADALTGDGLANILRGGGAADVLDGGAGVDTADYREKTVSVIATLNGAADAVVKIGGVNEDTIRNFENISGGSAGDTLTGDASVNVLLGNDGADFLSGNLGADVLDGGAGLDSADFREKSGAISITLNGAANVRVSVAGILEDTLRNVENIFSGSGADTLIGDGQANLFRGGLGQDVIDGGAGSDTADYREKSLSVAVTLNGATDAVVKVAGVAEDTIRNVENVFGGSGADTLIGDAAANSLSGGDGGDVLQGGLGADILDGGAGSDLADYSEKSSSVVVILNGSSSVAVSVGGVTEDTIRNIEKVFGGSAADTLIGDGLANTFRGGSGADLIDGGAGADIADYRENTSGIAVTLTGSTDATVTVGGVAEDTIRNIESVLGSSGHDVLTGDTFANTLSGNDGRDLLTGGGGADILDGGGGVDTASYRDKAASVVLTLNGAANATATIGGVAEDTLRNIENVLGGTGDDRLTGDAAANLLSGGGGNDILDGGAGSDTFQFDFALDSSSNVDTILNFSTGDKIALASSVFSALSTGALSNAQFFSGAGANAAQDSDDRIIYDSNSGALYYDADGFGGVSAIQFAMIDMRPTLSSGDFLIV
jgi:Ca2+-binding RTX toxin-like protein